MGLILPQYIRLLYEAYSASDAADRFDLHSDDPESVTEWKRLTEQERVAHLALVEFVAANTEATRKGILGINW